LASSKITELEDNYSVFLNSNILTSLAIFWNNASWKSSILKAINFWRNLILNSNYVWPNMWINWVIPFKLDDETIKKPSFFEFNFIVNNKYYRYNFSVNSACVKSENLYSKSLSDKRERILFTRENQNIRVVNFDDRWIKNNVLNNNLALYKFALENSEEALIINKFFHNLFVFQDWINNNIDTYNLLNGDNKEEFKNFLLSLLKVTNSWIADIIYVENKKDISSLPFELQEFIKQQPVGAYNWNIIERKCLFLHKKDWWNEYIDFNINEESFWTQKIFNLAGSLFNIMKEWMILFIDELDSSLSTKMLKAIINTFKNNYSNINISWNPQLIFTTNNTNLLDIQDIFRRDQIYFTKKETNYTDLYTLQSCKLKNDKWDLINIRKDLPTLEKYYLEWRIINVDND
jgi:hypothetical protein